MNPYEAPVQAELVKPPRPRRTTTILMAIVILLLIYQWLYVYHLISAP